MDDYYYDDQSIDPFEVFLSFLRRAFYKAYQENGSTAWGMLLPKETIEELATKMGFDAEAIVQAQDVLAFYEVVAPSRQNGNQECRRIPKPEHWRVLNFIEHDGNVDTESSAADEPLATKKPKKSAPKRVKPTSKSTSPVQGPPETVYTEIVPHDSNDYLTVTVTGAAKGSLSFTVKRILLESTVGKVVLGAFVLGMFAGLITLFG